MSRGLAFWIIFLLALLYSGWQSWPLTWAFGGSLLQFLMTLLLGWQVFGAPIRGDNRPNG